MKVFLSVTVDVDNDDMTTTGNRSGDRWASIALVPSISAIFERENTPATWFVRADRQIKLNYGSTTHFLNTHDVMWRHLESKGHEIAWHPHLYARTENGQFVPEYEDGACKEQLISSYSDICHSGWKMYSARIGEAFGSNAITATLRSFGLEADSTAIPGRHRSPLNERLDWRLTPNSPYIQDPSDYRVATRQHQGDPLVQVPMTTVPIQAEYDAGPIQRYINLTYHPAILLDRLGGYLDSLEQQSSTLAWVTTILHPDEVLPRPERHALYAFDIRAVEANLRGLLDHVNSRGWDIECTTIRQSAEISRRTLRAKEES
jgi:hypothetical protein